MQQLGTVFNYMPAMLRSPNTNVEKNNEFAHMSEVLINNFDNRFSRILSIKDDKFNMRDIIAEKVIRNIAEEFYKLANQLMNNTLTYSEYKRLNKTTLVPYVEENYKNKLETILLSIIQKYGIADLYKFKSLFHGITPFTEMETERGIHKNAIAIGKWRGAPNYELAPSIQALSNIEESFAPKSFTRPPPSRQGGGARKVRKTRKHRK